MKDEKFSSYYYEVIKLKLEIVGDEVVIMFKLGEQIVGYYQDLNNLDDLKENVYFKLDQLKRLYLNENEIMLSDNTVYLDVYLAVKGNINMFNLSSKVMEDTVIDSVYVGGKFLNKGVY